MFSNIRLYVLYVRILYVTARKANIPGNMFKLSSSRGTNTWTKSTQNQWDKIRVFFSLMVFNSVIYVNTVMCVNNVICGAGFTLLNTAGCESRTLKSIHIFASWCGTFVDEVQFQFWSLCQWYMGSNHVGNI